MKLTKLDIAILEELAIGEYHALETLNALFGKQSRASWSWVAKRLRLLRNEGYIGMYKPYVGMEPVFYLMRKGIDELAHPQDQRRRMLLRARATRGLQGATIEHNALRARFRTCLLLLQQQGAFTLTRWYHKDRAADVIGEFLHPDLGPITKPVNADAFFSVNDSAHYFLEVDMVSYAVERSDFGAGSSVEKHLLLYESLLQERWRLDPLGITYFNLLWLKRASQTNNDLRFATIRALLAEERFREVRKTIRFLSSEELRFGAPIVCETYDRRAVQFIPNALQEMSK